MTPSPIRNLAGKWLAAAFLLVATGIGAIWYSTISAYEAAVLRERGRELQAIAELKVEFIRFWLEVKRGNATVPGRSELIAHAAEFGLDRDTPSARSTLMERLTTIQTNYHYQSIMLLNRTGQVRAETGHRDENTRRHALATAREAMQAGKLRVSPAYETTSGGRPRIDIDIAAPVYTQGPYSPRIVGALVFQLDPRVNFDPFLHRWPAPNESGESFLFERVGEEIVYLSSLRHADAAQLRRRVDDPALPAALAARGGQGVVEGFDYRGVPVMAAVGQVPGMPWFVVSKLDRKEVLAPVQREALWSGTLSAFLVLALGLAMFSWQRRGQSELAMAQQAAAQAALSASEARFRRLIENAWDLLVLFDRGMLITYSSPSVDQQVGGKMLGESIARGTALVHPEDVGLVEAARINALAHPGAPQRFAHRLKGRYDHWMMVEASFTNHFDDPDIGALTYVGRDVSERMWAEQALRDSEERYRFLFKLSPDAVFVHRNGVIFQTNDAAVRLFRADSENALIGRHWRQLVAPERWPFVEQRIALLENGEQAYLQPSEQRYLTLDGQSIEVEATGARIVIDGNPAIMSVVRDIGERKQMERTLSESEARLRAIINSAPVGIAIADLQGRYLMVNPAQCRMLGRSEEELLGHSFAEFTHEEEVQANLDLAEQVQRGAIDIATMEKRYARKDGTTLWVLLTVGLVRDVRGETLGTVGIAQDIAERREAEQARLDFVQQQRDTLVREVHHRIKNHLQGLAGLLRQQLNSESSLKPMLEKLVAQINAISIVHGLQGKSEGGQTSLRGMISEITGFLGRLTGMPLTLADQEIQCFHEQPCAAMQICQWTVVEEESVSLALILNELLTNAMRHQDGPVPVSLNIHCGPQGARLTIRNSGRLSKELDFAGGKGLGTGLRLVRSLMPQQGMSISLANASEGLVETRIVLAAPVLARTIEIDTQVVSLR